MTYFDGYALPLSDFNVTPIMCRDDLCIRILHLPQREHLQHPQFYEKDQAIFLVHLHLFSLAIFALAHANKLQ